MVSAERLFIKEFGRKCGRHKFAGIIKILMGSSLIEKTGNYKVGLRGNCYRVVILSKASCQQILKSQKNQLFHLNWSLL